MFCTNCGKPLEKDRVFCGNCGKQVESNITEKDEDIVTEKLTCSKCGATFDDGVDFCIKCDTGESNHLLFCENCGAGIAVGDDYCYSCEEGVGLKDKQSYGTNCKTCGRDIYSGVAFSDCDDCSKQVNILHKPSPPPPSPPPSPDSGIIFTIVGVILAVAGFFGQNHARAYFLHCSHLDLVLSRRARDAFGYHCICELMQFVLYASYFVIVIGIIFAIIGFSKMIKNNRTPPPQLIQSFCTSCRGKIDAGSVFCKDCGAQQ